MSGLSTSMIVGALIIVAAAAIARMGLPGNDVLDAIRPRSRAALRRGRVSILNEGRDVDTVTSSALDWLDV
jgi:hypothetical protein